MRVPGLADILGTLPALDAVLHDVDRAGADLIVLNGDIADGPMPDRTLERLAGLGDRAVWVQGNSDRWLVDAFDGDLLVPGLATSQSEEWFEWCAARLGRAHPLHGIRSACAACSDQIARAAGEHHSR